MYSSWYMEPLRDESAAAPWERADGALLATASLPAPDEVCLARGPAAIVSLPAGRPGVAAGGCAAGSTEPGSTLGAAVVFAGDGVRDATMVLGVGFAIRKATHTAHAVAPARKAGRMRAGWSHSESH